MSLLTLNEFNNFYSLFFIKKKKKVDHTGCRKLCISRQYVEKQLIEKNKFYIIVET